MKIYIHGNDTPEHLLRCVSNLIAKYKDGFSDMVILCVGTDRSTGDSLGPLVGYKLENLTHENVHIYGTLNHPIHAKNIQETVNEIANKFSNPFILAIDACLGRIEHVGYLLLGEGPIQPGSGVGKQINPVGHAHICGVVNFSGFMDFVVLQNTRLSVVMDMADKIANAIRQAVNQLFEDSINHVEQTQCVLRSIKNSSRKAVLQNAQMG